VAYNEGLAQRIRAILEEKWQFVEKKMFGGICFMIHGNMACGILNDDLIVRVGPKNYEASLKLPHTRIFDYSGKLMKGWIMVSSAGTQSDKDLESWLEKGIDFSLTLPPK